MHNIVVLGGGTGSFTVLSGLKKLPNVNLTAIVPATDSGGSTGRLRDEFGSLPIGDVRQCLAALAEDQEESFLLRELFTYRFDKGGTGLEGHNLGNLLLTALTEILGDELKAIRSVEKLMNIQGHVYPVSLHKSNLVAEYDDGKLIKGEHFIDEPQYPHDGRSRIIKLAVEPELKTYTAVKKALQDADIILLGPGDLYTSLVANLVVEGIPAAIKASKAKFVFIVNLVTKFGQTYGYTAQDFVDEISRYATRTPDYILMNDNHLPQDILQRYELEYAYPVIDDLGDGKNIIRKNLLAREEIVSPKGDVLKRSLIRHDGQKIAEVIQEILTNGI